MDRNLQGIMQSSPGLYSNSKYDKVTGLWYGYGLFWKGTDHADATLFCSSTHCAGCQLRDLTR